LKAATGLTVPAARSANPGYDVSWADSIYGRLIDAVSGKVERVM
jgi:hypothetical protein